MSVTLPVLRVPRNKSGGSRPNGSLNYEVIDISKSIE